MKNALSRLALGTAQLGLDYGIANREGRPDREKAFRILDAALKNGVRVFDTAAAYGESERIIGEYLSLRKCRAQIITKISALGEGVPSPAQELMRRFRTSLENLRQKKVSGVMLHCFDDFMLYTGECLEFFRKVKQVGLAEMAGLSVYRPEEVLGTIKHKEIGMFQIPFNLFDQKWLDRSFLSALKKRRILLFVRSIFLQGLFFLSREEMEKKVPRAVPYRQELDRLSRTYGIPVRDLAFRFARDRFKKACILFGVLNEEQVRENTRLLKEKPLPRKLTEEIFSVFRSVPEEVTNPVLWK